MPENNRPIINIPLLDSDAGRESVLKICKEHGVREEDLYDLLKSQIDNSDAGRRNKLFADFDGVFGEGEGEIEETADVD